MAVDYLGHRNTTVDEYLKGWDDIGLKRPDAPRHVLDKLGRGPFEFELDTKTMESPRQSPQSGDAGRVASGERIFEVHKRGTIAPNRPTDRRIDADGKYFGAVVTANV